MAIEVLLDLIRQCFSPAERKIVAKGLQQDPLVWQFVKDEEQSLPYFETAGSDLSAYSPGKIAAWLIEKHNGIPLQDINRLDTVIPNELKQIAAKVFESTFNTGLPPADLYSAGLLALTLRERRKIKGNWQRISDEILIQRGQPAIQKNVLIWRTPFACLFTLCPDFDDLMMDFFQSKSERKAKTVLPLLIHTVLANPLKLQERLDKLFEYTSVVSIDLQLDSLKWLNTYKRYEISKTLAQNLLQVKPNVDYLARVFAGLEAFKSEPEGKEPLSKQVSFTLPEDLNRLAAFYHYSGDPQKAANTYRKAGEVLEFIKAQTLFQSAISVNDATSQTTWLEIIKSVPHSQQARFFYIKSLIDGQDYEEASRLLADLPDSEEKSILSFLTLKSQDPKSTSQSTLMESLKRLTKKSLPTDKAYFIHKPVLDANSNLLNELLREIDLNLDESQLETDFSDPQILTLVRNQYMTSHQFNKAIELTSYLELIEPDEQNHKRKLAELYSLAKRWPQAYATVQQIVKSEATPALDDLILFAESALHTDRTDMAISICQNILKQDPQNAKALVLIGEGFWQKGDVVKAIQHMEKVVEMIPEEAETWLALARLWQENGQFDRALEVLNKGALVIPDNPALLRALGKSHLEKQSPADALTYLKKAFEIDSQNVEGQLDLARANYQLGHYEQSWTILEPYLEHYDQDPAIARLLGHVLLAMDKKQQAKPILLTAAKHSPEDSETVFAVTELVLNESEVSLDGVDHGELAMVKSILSKSLGRYADDFQLRLYLADVDRLTGNNQEAFSAYSSLSDNDLSEKSMQSWRLQYGLGESAMALGKSDMGLAALQEAATHQPENTTILHALAKAYQTSELGRKANDTAKTALKLAPQDLNNILWYARFRMENNEPEEAVKALKEALVIVPDRPELKLWLSRTLISSGAMKEAEKNIEALIKDSKPSSQDLHQAAYIGIQLNNLDLAIQALEKAEQQSEGLDYVLLMDLAVAYATQGQMRKALEALTVKDDSFIQHPELALLKADLLGDLSQYELALSTLTDIDEVAMETLSDTEELSNNFKKSPLLYTYDFSLKGYFYRVGQFQRCLGENDEAKSKFEQALSIDPDDLKTRLACVEAYAINMDFSKALEIAKAGMKAGAVSSQKNQDFLDLVCTQAEISFYMNDPEEASRFYKVISTGMTTYPRTLALQSRLAARMGEMEVARDYLDEALKSHRENEQQQTSASVQNTYRQIMNLNSMAEAALELQDYSLSIELENKAVGVFQNQPLLSWRYANTLIKGAEAQRTSEALSITAHAPGKTMLSEEHYSQFRHHLELVQSTLDQEDWLCLKARGTSAFEGEWQLELNIDPCLNDLDAAVAIVMGSNDDEIVQEVLEAYPNEPAVLLAYGIYALKSNKDDGVQIVEKALQADTSNPINHALLAYLNREDPEVALKSIETALQFWPNEAGWHAYAADLEVQTGKQAGASQHIALALEADPNNSIFWQKSADIKLQNNDLEHAKEDLEKSVAFMSKDPSAWLKLADVNRRMGSLSEAIDNVRNASNLDPANKNIAIKEAQLMLDQNDYAGAIEKTTILLHEDIHADDARIILAQAYAKQGKFDQALGTLDESLKENPNNIKLALEAIKIKKEFEGAEATLPELIILAQENPENAAVLTLLTDLLIQTNRLDKAEQTAQTILRIIPEGAEVHLMLGRLQRKNGQLDQAIAHLSDAIAYDPTLVEAYIELGKTYQERRDLEEAIKIFQKGSQANASDPRPYYFAGMALKECKDYNGAEAMLKQAKKFAPDDANVIRQLGVITAMNLINNLRETS